MSSKIKELSYFYDSLEEQAKHSSELDRKATPSETHTSYKTYLEVIN